MRRALLTPVLLVLAGAQAASAAEQRVSIGDFAFRPAEVRIEPGDTVTWSWDGPDTNHSVTSGAGQAESFESHPGTPTGLVSSPPGSTFSHTFTRTGTFTYLCRVHPTSMHGRVIVADGSPDPADEDRTAPRIGSFRARPARFCKRHRRCRRPGTRLTFTLSERATLGLRASGRVDGRRVVRTFDLGTGRRGRNSERFLAERLPVGAYLLRLTATDAAGNSRTARTRIRIVPPPPPPRR